MDSRIKANRPKSDAANQEAAGKDPGAQRNDKLSEGVRALEQASIALRLQNGLRANGASRDAVKMMNGSSVAVSQSVPLEVAEALCKKFDPGVVRTNFPNKTFREKPAQMGKHRSIPKGNLDPEARPTAMRVKGGVPSMVFPGKKTA